MKFVVNIGKIADDKAWCLMDSDSICWQWYAGDIKMNPALLYIFLTTLLSCLQRRILIFYVSENVWL